MGGASIGFAIAGIIGLVFMRKYGPSGPVVCFILAGVCGVMELLG